jgi:hypothetical protein
VTKKVVGVFVRFRAPLHEKHGQVYSNLEVGKLLENFNHFVTVTDSSVS